ncbi:MAG: ArsR family transcriptional regulator [Candidatus Nanoarchaeia archaeon]
MVRQKIIIQETDKPNSGNVEEEVRWICNSLGLTKGRDIDNISFRVMYTLLNLFTKRKLISTEELSKKLNVEPYKINHHIRSLMESGIIFREKRKIALRGGSLSSAIEEMKRDSESLFERLLETSRKIDKLFHLHK